MRKKYTLEFKEEAAKLVTEQGYSKNKAALVLGVDKRNIGRWVDTLQENSTIRLAKKNIRAQKTPQHEETKQLRKENERLRMERDILKKAVAFFASEKI